MSISADPPDRELTLAAVLEARVARGGAADFVLAETGACTLADLHRRSDALARGLLGMGLNSGDTLLVMLPNCVEFIELWWAAAKVGVVEVPVNTAYLGALLAHVINDSGADTIVLSTQFLDRVADLAGRLPALKRVVLLEPTAPPPTLAPGWLVAPLADLYRGGPAALPPPPSERDLMAVMYTSGTTGPSKGVMVTHAHAYHYALACVDLLRLGPDDIYIGQLPLFHIAGQWAVVYASLIAGSRVALVPRFDAERFWQQCARHGVTTTFLLGAMASALYRRPPAPDDSATPLAKALIVPQLPQMEDFARRFACAVTTTYGSTEANVPVKAHFDLPNASVCGRARDELYELRIVDAHDYEVPPGVAGELTVRAKRPWILMAGYWNHPEWTVTAWRNLWLHTGDAMMRDGAGNYYFVDRLKDAIRRKGENISSMEVENEIGAHPAVLECAVVPAKVADGEDEVFAIVVPRPGARFDPADLVRFLAPRLPHFMVPRYVEIATSLPKTPTGKIQKYSLRERGVTAATWDRVAAGLRLRDLVKREKTA
jgi:crotonobetaine/carnitine-CoA ligase